MKVEKGKSYYYAKNMEPFICIEPSSGENEQSTFLSKNGAEYMFYNHDVYTEPFEEDKSLIEAPPLGIEPEYIWKQRRCFELIRVIYRHDQAGKCSNVEWLEELASLIQELYSQKQVN